MNRLVMMSACRTCLIYHVNEGLDVVPKEAADRIARILTREDLLNQGREFMWRKRASDQTFTGWSVEVEKKYSYKNGGAEGVPLLDPEGLLANRGPTGAKRGVRLPVPRFSSRDELGALITLSISWISNLCSSTLSWPYSMRGQFGPLLRFRSISHITLDQIGSEGGRPEAKGIQPTFLNPQVPSSHIR